MMLMKMRVGNRRGCVVMGRMLLSSSSSSGSSSVEEEQWEFVAPRSKKTTKQEEQKSLAKTNYDWTWDAPSRDAGRRRQPLRSDVMSKSGPLTADECVELLRLEGAEEVTSLKLPLEVPLGDAMVFATARSASHLLGLASGLVGILKSRGLGGRNCVDGDGEGDGWIAVDVGNLTVHLMLKDARERLQLEDYWDLTNPNRTVYHEELDRMIPADICLQPPPDSAKERRKRLRRARRAGSSGDDSTIGWF